MNRMRKRGNQTHLTILFILLILSNPLHLVRA
jgi:hypothetical protein